MPRQRIEPIPPRDPQQIKDAIEEKSDHVRDAAAGISERIERFEQWLGKLPGRTETTFSRELPDASDDDDTAVFGIRLHRPNKQWIISCASYRYDEDDQPIDWKPLSDAPLRQKLFAIKMFPDLLEAIEKSQAQLVSEIEDAANEFDSFAGKLGIDRKEGK